MLYYKMFKSERSLFNVRFIFDCYIAIQYEINGILLSDKAVQNNIENIFTHKFLHFMVEDQYEIRDSEYLPFFALIQCPNQKQLLKLDQGISLFNALNKKFGDHQREPYVSPRDKTKKKRYHQQLIKKHVNMEIRQKEMFQLFLAQNRLKQLQNEKSNTDSIFHQNLKDKKITQEEGFNCAYISPGIQNLIGCKNLQGHQQVKIFRTDEDKNDSKNIHILKTKIQKLNKRMEIQKNKKGANKKNKKLKGNNLKTIRKNKIRKTLTIKQKLLQQKQIEQQEALDDELKKKSYKLPKLFEKEFEEVYKLRQHLNQFNTNFYSVYKQKQNYEKYFRKPQTKKQKNYYKLSKYLKNTNGEKLNKSLPNQSKINKQITPNENSQPNFIQSFQINSKNEQIPQNQQVKFKTEFNDGKIDSKGYKKVKQKIYKDQLYKISSLQHTDSLMVESDFKQKYLKEKLQEKAITVTNISKINQYVTDVTEQKKFDELEKLKNIECSNDDLLQSFYTDKTKYQLEKLRVRKVEHALRLKPNDNYLKNKYFSTSLQNYKNRVRKYKRKYKHIVKDQHCIGNKINILYKKIIAQQNRSQLAISKYKLNANQKRQLHKNITQFSNKMEKAFQGQSKL